MPIDYSIYPKNWKEISKRVRERADQKCEWCEAPNGAYIHRKAENPGIWALEETVAADGVTWLPAIRIVLTVAHLDHNPESDDETRMAALCQRCHLTYDAKHHARNAAETRARKKGLVSLFAGEVQHAEA